VKRYRSFAIGSGVVLLSAALLSLLDGTSFSVWGVLSYTVLLAVCSLIGAWLWKRVEPGEKPRWLLIAMLAAFTVRVLLGLGFATGLPKYGYRDSEPQRAGYVFSDAYKRDSDALARARSEKPLISAFTDRKTSDQYGGLLYLSALIYRYLSPDAHRPMLIVTLVAAISSIAVLFTWALYSRIWGSAGLKLATWLVVLYPDAAMLGASQMREPFLIAAFAISLYGYSLIRDHDTRSGILTILGGILLLALPISPPFAIAILLLVGGAWIWEGQRVQARWILLFLLVSVIVLVSLTLVIRSWQGLQNIQGSAWRILVDWWEDAGGDWRINLLSEQSAWLDNVLDLLPSWADVPFLVLYGLLQPFLPASLAATGAPLWRAIAIWRSLGWYVLLPLFIYAPVLAIRRQGWRSLEAFLAAVVWLTALLASYRALGFQWDNPRYRAVFLAAQAAVAAWTWTNARQERSPWLRRIYVLLAGATLIVLQWYLGRYYGTPRLGLGPTLVVVVVYFVLVLAGGWVRDHRRRTDHRIEAGPDGV